MLQHLNNFKVTSSCVVFSVDLVLKFIAKKKKTVNGTVFLEIRMFYCLFIWIWVLHVKFAKSSDFENLIFELHDLKNLSKCKFLSNVRNLFSSTNLKKKIIWTEKKTTSNFTSIKFDKSTQISFSRENPFRTQKINYSNYILIHTSTPQSLSEKILINSQKTNIFKNLYLYFPHKKLQSNHNVAFLKK